MRFLLDMPVSRALIAVLERHGHDGAHVQDLGLGRSPDSELLATARLEGAVVITAERVAASVGVTRGAVHRLLDHDPGGQDAADDHPAQDIAEHPRRPARRRGDHGGAPRSSTRNGARGSWSPAAPTFRVPRGGEGSAKFLLDNRGAGGVMVSPHERKSAGTVLCLCLRAPRTCSAPAHTVYRGECP